MDSFEYQNPVKIIFGKDRVFECGKYIKEIGENILLVIGGKSAERTGNLDKVKKSLKDNKIKYTILKGVKSNPLLSKVREGIKIVKEKNIKVLVALGGGSVMDTAKAIASGSLYEGDVWDFFTAKSIIKKALPIVTIPTLAASGSEMNGFMVITEDETNYKLSCGSIYVYPKVSILDPTLTYSVPPNYTAYGGVDAVCHLLEPYFNGEYKPTYVQDSIAEGLIKTIIKVTKKCIEEPENYDARATIMWAASLALCGLTKAGIGKHFFPVHFIEHALSGLYDVPHGAGLSALLPGWMRWKAEKDDTKILQLGKNVFNLQNPTVESTIKSLCNWFEEIKSPKSLKELNIPKEDFEKIAKHTQKQVKIWGAKEYTVEVIKDILGKSYI